jgi:hypothetical protein
MQPICHARAGFRRRATGRQGLEVLLLLLLGEQGADLRDRLGVDRLDRGNPVVAGDRRIAPQSADLHLLHHEQPSHTRLLHGIEIEALREDCG